MKFLRRHVISLAALSVGALFLALFTWGDWHTYAQDQQQHQQLALFWSLDFLAHWLDNAAQNWHSEIIFGIWLAWHITRGQQKGDRDG